MPPATPNPSRLGKILLVEDDAITCAFVRRVLETDGFQVVIARDGKEGLALFRAHSPSLVLTDYLLPDMTGAEVTRQMLADIQERDGRHPRFVPIVVFTALDQPEVLKECLEAGAVEFLTKTLTAAELRAAIRSIAEPASAHAGRIARDMEEQEELSVVKHVLGRLVEHSQATLPGEFQMETLPTRRINGDVCVYHAGAPGIHFGMVCDPMGHGLMAGISGIPTMDVFNALSTRDLPLPGFLAEINRKLLHLLPFGRFCCVILFRMDTHTGDLQVLSSAMPDAVVFRRDGGLVRFASTCIPLGIREDLGDLKVERLNLEPGDCFFACSDGLSEVVDEAELVGLFQEGGAAHFSELLRNLLQQRIQDRELSDDVSWCLWPFRLEPNRKEAPQEPGVQTQRPAETERLSFRLTFRPGTLNYHEVGPNFVGFLQRHGVPEEVSNTLALLLSEAVVNAVDHGLLGLQSVLKEAGFEHYEAERRLRLTAGGPGEVELKVRIHQRPDGGFAKVAVQVSDPGPGFDWRQYLAQMEVDSGRFYGRGLALLKTLSRDLAFNEAGNVVTFSLYTSED